MMFTLSEISTENPVLHVSSKGVFTWHKDAEQLIQEMPKGSTKAILEVLWAATNPAPPQRKLAGYIVFTGEISDAALYPLSKEVEAFDAAKRWNATIRPVTMSSEDS